MIPLAVMDPVRQAPLAVRGDPRRMSLRYWRRSALARSADRLSASVTLSPSAASASSDVGNDFMPVFIPVAAPLAQLAWLIHRRRVLARRQGLALNGGSWTSVEQRRRAGRRPAARGATDRSHPPPFSICIDSIFEYCQLNRP